MLYTLAGKFPQGALKHRPLVAKYVMQDKVLKPAQASGILAYLKKLGPGELDVAALEEAGGVGVEVTAADIEAGVKALLDSERAQIEAERYKAPLHKLFAQLKVGPLQWGDGKAVKDEFDAQVLALLGPKTEADLAKPAKKKKEKKPAAEAAQKSAGEAEAEAKPEDPYAFLPKPEENHMVHTTVNFSDGSVMRIANSPEQLKEHLAATGGKVVTRFPPEPNGYLHIGHAKAMNIDFGMARRYGGVCYLRYDDTNPEAEKQEYIDHIQEIVRWLGWEPWKITYSSDYFQQLYDHAVRLIKAGKAYVCHQTGDEISAYREKRMNSPWRDRPVAESLRIFEDMRRGLVDEGTATLRMKMDMQNVNFNMFDLIAYRIKFAEHPKAGDKWCVYPSYDFTHGLVDSIENISHSLCTLEFETRRASYYWELEELGVYKPKVWEYARLNITNTVMSKRKLNSLVMEKHVNGWDDPRLPTLSGLRRRGYTPDAINAFCRDIGITRNENEIPLHRLEHHIRLDLDARAPRAMAVVEPLMVSITNLPKDFCEEFDARKFPGRDGGTYKVPMGTSVYIERSDFREEDARGYYGLAPGKLAMLRYAFVIRCTGVKKDVQGKVTGLQAERVELPEGQKPPKGVLHWVPAAVPGRGGAGSVRTQFRMYDVLFKSSTPAALENWREDLNPHSLRVVDGGWAVPAMAGAKAGEQFQLERSGYYCVDPDSTPDLLVLNRTCSLREAKGK